MWNDIIPEDQPWDVQSVFVERKYLDWRQLEIMLRTGSARNDAPRPTPNTLADPHGFEMWTEYMKEAEEEMRHQQEDGSYKDWPGGGLPMLNIPGFTYVPAFDNKVWRKSQSLVLYDYGNSFMYKKKQAMIEARNNSKPETYIQAQNAGTPSIYR